MAKGVQDERDRRRRLGQICLVVFLLFNASMVGWLLSYWGTFGEDAKSGSEVEWAGAVIDATVTTSVVLLIWVVGAAITGVLAYLGLRFGTKNR